jgi:hypothetical protein
MCFFTGFFTWHVEPSKSQEGAVNMNPKDQKRSEITRELMENAKEQIDSSSELEQNLENLGLQRRMKQLDLESKLLKKPNNELS